MTQVRQNQRYYIQDKEKFLVKVETNAGKSVECLLNDISVSGACIILDKQIFLARDREYPFHILRRQSGRELENIASAKGKIIWYLSKEFRNQDMIFLGIEFQNKIPLPESILSEAGASA